MYSVYDDAYGFGKPTSGLTAKEVIDLIYNSKGYQLEVKQRGDGTWKVDSNYIPSGFIMFRRKTCSFRCRI